MAEPSLVVTFASLEAIQAALTSAQQDILDEVTRLRGDVDREIAGWRAGTDSRDAQLAFDRDLAGWSEQLSAALASVATALTTVTEAAHDAEVRNVAILD